MSTPSGGASVSKRLTFFGQGLHSTIQRAGSVITNGLRSCDDASEVFAAGNEFLVNRQHDGERRNNGADSLSKRLSAVSPSDVFRAQLWGDNKFKMTMQWMAPDGKRPGDKDSIYGSVVIQAFSEVQKSEIPLRISWQRKCVDQVFPIEFDGQSFPITADDMCCSIRVQATATHSDMGTAYGEIGPFEIDAAMRNTIQDYIHNGGSVFPVEILDNADTTIGSTMEADEKSLTLHISSDEVKLTKPGPRNIGYLRNWQASMSGHQSLVELDQESLSSCTFSLRLHAEQSTTPSVIRVAALSRRQRDTIVLLIRALQAAQAVKTMLLMEQAALNTQRKDAGFEKENTRRTRLDFFIIFDQLNRQTLESLNIAVRAGKERRRAVAERDALELDINDTIQMYQRLLADSDSKNEHSIKDTTKVAQEITQRAALMADLQTQLREVQLQAKKYVEEIELNRRDYRDLQNRYEEKERQLKAWLEEGPSKNTFTDNGQMRVIELEGHLRNLEQMNLTADRESCKLRRALDETKNAAAKEAAKRLESFDMKIRQLEVDRDEAQQNFLYIKEKYDKLENEQRAAAHISLENSGHFERSEREARREADVCKTRMRDLELKIEDFTRRVEDLTISESKLRKQNDSLNKQLDKLRDAGGHQTQQIIDLNRSLLMTRGGDMMETGSDDLRAKLATTEQECARLRAENEGLRRKCRKLAATA